MGGMERPENEFPDFCKWLADRWTDNQIHHSYQIPANRRDWIEHNRNCRIWETASLHEAYTNYFWRGLDYDGNAEELESYRLWIQEALRDRDDMSLSCAIRQVFAWGALIGEVTKIIGLISILSAKRSVREWNGPSHCSNK